MTYNRASLSSSYRFHILNLVNPILTLWLIFPIDPVFNTFMSQCADPTVEWRGRVTLFEEKTVISSVLEKSGVLEVLQTKESAGSESHLCFS